MDSCHVSFHSALTHMPFIPEDCHCSISPSGSRNNKSNSSFPLTVRVVYGFQKNKKDDIINTFQANSNITRLKSHYLEYDICL